MRLHPRCEDTSRGRGGQTYHRLKGPPAWRRAAEETFRLAAKPRRVTVDDPTLEERRDRSGDGWMWLEMEVGGVLRIRHAGTTQVAIVKRAQP